MADVIGNGRARTLVDVEGDAVTVTGTALDVNIASGVADIDIGDVEITGHSTMVSGSNADIDSGDDEVLGAGAACKEIVIQASTANTGIVYVGSENVTALTGIALYAGDAFSFNIDNVDNVFVRASVDNQAVTYLYFN